MNQCEKIEAYIRDFGQITQLDAMRDLGVMRLASRISDMKKSGLNIITLTGSGVNRYGEKTHFAIYKIKEIENE